MKSLKPNLHLQWKKESLFLLGYAVIVLLLTIVVAVSTGSDLAQLSAITESGYVYSVKTQNSTEPDAYYQYSAGISFSVYEDARSGINAEVVMQTENAQYTDLVYWNAERLSKNAVAITKNIADVNGLSIGDVLYSKNIVDGKICEFTIEAILPAATYTRGYKDEFHNDGVIIIGYDSAYADNVAYTCIVFTNKPIEELAPLCTSMPEDLVYREDEISSLVKCIVPYMVVYIFGTTISLVILAVFINKGIAHNFRRLIMLGFERKALNKAYYEHVWQVGGIAIVFALVDAIIAFASVGWIAFVPAVSVAVTGVCVLIVAATRMNKRLWRK